MQPHRRRASSRTLSAHSPTARALLVAALFALACLAVAGPARGQQRPNDPAATYRRMAERQHERSTRAVETLARRRMEERRDDSQAGNRAGARPGVLRATTNEERQALAHNDKGLALFDRGKHEEAVREYEAAVRLHPALAAAHNNMGGALFALARYGEAAAAFRRATEIEPRYGRAHLNLAFVHAKLGREREAGEALRSATRAFIETCEELYGQGHLEEAEESFAALLGVDPNYCPALLRLGMVRNAARRYGEAVEVLARHASLRPDSAEGLERLAEALHGENRHADAAAQAERATILAPASAGAHFYAGLAHAALGHRERALAAHARLLELKAEAEASRLAAYIEQKSPARK
jgi:tetratricopeptide (TPR) repeat protein